MELGTFSVSLAVKDLTASRAFDYWFRNPGFQDPRLSGLIADEFSGRQNPTC